MSLNSLIDVVQNKDRPQLEEIDKGKIKDNLETYQKIISYWRIYPDRFVDYLCSLNPDNKFKFFYFQRIYLRIAMRYRTTYATFSRGFSKSFLAVMCLMLKCVLYPGTNLITVADGKSQSAKILQDKLGEICKLIPALAREIDWDTRGKPIQTTQSKDSVQYAFKNGSTLRNVSMTETSRGQRAQGVLTEEVATIRDQQKYEEIVAPMLVISRKVNGQVDPKEMLNQNDIYVTSAGFKGTYAYDKLIDALCRMIAGGKYEAFAFGGDWRVKSVRA